MAVSDKPSLDCTPALSDQNAGIAVGYTPVSKETAFAEPLRFCTKEKELRFSQVNRLT